LTEHSAGLTTVANAAIATAPRYSCLILFVQFCNKNIRLRSAVLPF